LAFVELLLNGKKIFNVPIFWIFYLRSLKNKFLINNFGRNTDIPRLEEQLPFGRNTDIPRLEEQLPFGRSGASPITHISEGPAQVQLRTFRKVRRKSNYAQIGIEDTSGQYVLRRQRVQLQYNIQHTPICSAAA
jgi:hypothetical protein